MLLAEVLARIQEPEARAALCPHWEESMATFGGGLPSFLDPAEFSVSREWGGLAPEMEAVLEETAWRVASDPALVALAWHCYRLLYEHPEYNDCRRWPALQNVLGEQSGAFYLLIALAMVPRVRVLHQSLGVPESVTRDTCRQLWCFSDNYRRGHKGRLGIPVSQIYWLRLYVQGRLFRLGRMEYKIELFRGAVEVYRHRQTGETIALAEDGVSFDGDGFVTRPAENGDPGSGWRSRLVREETSVTGTPYSPSGMALPREVCLPLDTWERALRRGDPVLDMHIPAGGGMTPEKCGESFRQAAEFFRRLFPDRPCRAISCTSWIFNTQLEEILPPGANLTRFQHELYLYPVLSSGTDGLWFIFLQDDFDPQTAPRETSLQRAVLDFLAAGNTWRMGAMFFLLEDLPRFGTEHYRAHWPAFL